MNLTEGADIMEKAQAIRSKAQLLFDQQKDWATFFREVLGTSGIVHQLYPDTESRMEFEQTPEYNELQQMLTKLRDRNGQPPPEDEATRVITVRIPKCLHESLKTEAHSRKTSMNQLCISKLVQRIDAEMIPNA
ncbi:MAG TPA: toxin-antitoxin system HicB family antitoxin [Pirellulales bacterium]|jgi:predicted HicB family RNase H-like nuclease|nr:toxin-antitoxin system HicB family antitoxin [Pirellulales bacterium]